MTKEDRGVIADWLVLISAVGLLLSLFLTWSSLSPSYIALADRLQTLQGVPHDPTAWQVYSAADVVLALLAAGLIVVALSGKKRGQVFTLVAAVLALGFVIHATSSPPTNGAADAFRPSPGVAAYVAPAPAPAPGPGEIVAIVSLVVAIGGIAVSMRTV